MNVLVIGGSGFLGSHIVDRFLRAGWQVTVYDRRPERFRPTPDGVHLVLGEFGNRGQLGLVLSGGFDIVVHCVSTTTPQSSNEDPEFDVSTNVIESIHLLELCRTHRIGKVVFLSSGGTIYGNSTMERIAEGHPTMPLCSYAISKLAVEKYLFMYQSIYGQDYVALRPSNPYGPRQDPSGNLGAITVFLSRIVGGENVALWGDGSIVRDYIYVTDVAAACYAAATKSVTGVFNIGSGVGQSLKQILDLIATTTGTSPGIDWLPGRRFDIQRIVLDCSAAKQQLNWVPKVEIVDGLRTTYDWLRSRPGA